MHEYYVLLHECSILELIVSLWFSNCFSDFIFMLRLIYGFCTRFFSVHLAPVCHMLHVGPARLMILSPVETVLFCTY